MNSENIKYSTVRRLNVLKAFRGYSWQTAKATVAWTLCQNNPDSEFLLNEMWFKISP